jgi:hypothetical protein
MLIAGIVNPPPVTTPGYGGVYLSTQDDLPGQALSLAGKPLRVEHKGETTVGRVLQGWQDARTGALYALAEIDETNLPGALAAAAVDQGRFGEFSLGYSSRIERQQQSGKWVATDKRILELSLVKKGARPQCQIALHSHPYAKRTKTTTSSSSHNKPANVGSQCAAPPLHSAHCLSDTARPPFFRSS